jgi:acyl dehydratase
MPLNADYILSREFPPIETEITDRDVMFYALSIGLGRDPMNAAELPYVYERDLLVFPSMPLVIGHPGNWMSDPETGINRTMVVHGAQRLATFEPLPVGGRVITHNRVTDIWDKGDKGAILELTRETFDVASGNLLARSQSSVFCRADGGFGGPSGPAYEFRAIPDRSPDDSIDMPSDPGMALLYRLNNDRNPLHADPEFAARAGFTRPILHGLATFGLAAVALARARPGETITSFEARFSKPVLPGETVTVTFWNERDGAGFQAHVGDRLVLDRGWATLA